MAKAVLTLIVMLLSNNLLAQSTFYEQKAVNYFFDTIFREKYNEKVVEFSGYTEKILTDFGLVENCFKDENTLHIKLRERSFDKTFEKQAIYISEIKDVSFKKIKMKSSKRLKMQILLANGVDEKVYVLIDIVKQHHYTDAYMFELEKDGKILRWCKTGILH